MRFLKPLFLLFFLATLAFNPSVHSAEKEWDPQDILKDHYYYHCRYCYLQQHPEYISNYEPTERASWPNERETTCSEHWRIISKLKSYLQRVDKGLMTSQEDYTVRLSVYGYFENTMEKKIPTFSDPWTGEIIKSSSWPVFPRYYFYKYFRSYSAVGASAMTSAINRDVQCSIDEMIGAERKRILLYQKQSENSSKYQHWQSLISGRHRFIQALESYKPKVTEACAEAAAEFAQLIQRDIERCQKLTEYWDEKSVVNEHQFGYLNPNLSFEKSYIHFLNGNYFDFLKGIENILDDVEENDEIMLAAGETYSELGLYSEAIKCLSKAIRANPENKKAYFERAIAYFELGNFDQALEDYVLSDFKPISFQEASLGTLEFAGGLIKGASFGAAHSIENFVPSMLCSLQGLANGLWSFALDPKEVSKEMVQAAKNIYEFMQDKSAVETLRTLIPELDELIGDWKEHDEFKKGELIGTIIGRYGTDVFVFAGSAKAVRLFEELRVANASLTLGAMKSSEHQLKLLNKSSNWGKAISSKKKELEIQVTKETKEALKKYRGANLNEKQVRKILHEIGVKTYPIPQGMDISYYNVSISKNGGGMVYALKSNEHINIRVMPGSSTSSNPAQRKPYVVHKTPNGALDKNGKLVKGNTIEAHIPIEEYDFVKLSEAHNGCL